MHSEAPEKSPAVLSIIDWYFPSYKAGGPVRSLVNIAALLQGTVQFYVMCGLQEIDGTPLDVPHNKFVQGPFNEKVLYTYKPSYIKLKKWEKNNPGGVFHINGMYSLWFTIWPLFLVRFFLKSSKVVVSPRGMLNPGALAIKGRKKRLFLNLAKVLGLFSKVLWHATSLQEKECILRVFPRSKQIEIVSNIPVLPMKEVAVKQKEPGELLLFSMTRVVPIKVLEKLAEALRNKVLVGNIILDIYGPIEDEPYAEKLTQQYSQISAITLNFKGPVEPFMFAEIASNYDVFYLPSANENFGHAIFEAFAHSVPVLISDQTPWRNLVSKHAGWDIPLHSTLDFEKACKQALAWDTNTLAEWKRGALDFAHANYNATQWIQQYKQLFTSNV